MSDINNGATLPEESGRFTDPSEEIAALRTRIDEVISQIRSTTDLERRERLRWWVVGARKHLGRLGDVVSARRRGMHRFVIHEMEGDLIWAVCSCGVRFPGRMHRDFTLEAFPLLEGHRTDQPEGPGRAECADGGAR